MPKLRKPDNSTYFTFLSEFEGTFEGQTEIEMFFLTIFMAVGVTGNILILTASWRLGRPLPVVNLLLANKSLSDLLQALMYPFIMATRHTRHWTLGPVLCPLLNYTQHVAFTVSIACLTLLAVHLYFAVCRASQSGSGQGSWAHRHSTKLVVATWAAPVLWFIPNLVGWKVLTVEQDGVTYTWCYLTWPDGLHQSAFMLTTATTIIILPTAVIVFCHYKAFVTVRQSSRRITNGVVPTGTGNGSTGNGNGPTGTGNRQSITGNAPTGNGQTVRRNVPTENGPTENGPTRTGIDQTETGYGSTGTGNGPTGTENDQTRRGNGQSETVNDPVTNAPTPAKSNILAPASDEQTTEISTHAAERRTTELRPETSARTAELRPDISARTTELRPETSARTTELRPDISARTTELETDISARTTELRPGISACTTELRPDISARTTELRPETSAPASRRRSMELRLLKLLMMSVVVFGVMWLPFFVFLVVFTVLDSATSTQYLLVLLLATSEGCVNPFLIVHLNADYRNQVSKLLRLCGLDKCLKAR